MNDNLLFSVVIPTYNRAEKLKETLNSVLQQEYCNYEVLVIDDGGSDNTREIVDSFKDSRFKYYWKENEERSIARNFGIFKSQGDYICFLDSDDIWYPEHLLHAASEIVKNKFPEIFHTSFEYITELNKITSKVVISDVDIKSLLNHNYLCMNSICIKREIAIQYHFLPSRHAILSEDHYLWLRLAARYKFICSSRVTNAIIKHEERSLNNIDPEKAFKNYQVIFEELDKDSILNSDKYRRCFAKMKASKYIFNGLCYSLNKNNRMAIKCLSKAFKFYPLYSLHYRFLVVLKKIFFNTISSNDKLIKSES